jgi:hypothetical protein
MAIRPENTRAWARPPRRCRCPAPLAVLYEIGCILQTSIDLLMPYSGASHRTPSRWAAGINGHVT